MVSTAMVRTLWSDTDPLGREFSPMGGFFELLESLSTFRIFILVKQTARFFYGASTTNNALDAQIFARVTGDASAIVRASPQLARQLNPNVMPSMDTLEQALERTLAPSRTVGLLTTVLGILAMVLAVVGIWGIVAYAASQRAHEIGIRKARGARPGNIMTLLLSQGTRLAAIGLAIGIALGAGVAQVLSATGLLFGLSALDPATYLTIALVFVNVTLIACYLPARQALCLDPMVALRYE